jgi:hypothetical protein
MSSGVLANVRSLGKTPVWAGVTMALALGIPFFLIIRTLVRQVRWLRALWEIRFAETGTRAMAFFHALNWYRQTLGALVLCSSAAYLLLSIASVTLRGAVDVKVNAYLAPKNGAFHLNQK